MKSLQKTGKISSYKDLDVWQRAISLVTDIYKITGSFPREELFGLTSQIRRATCSVPLNIAEGWGRESTKSYIQFLKISRGSILEVETCLLICKNLNYISLDEYIKIDSQIEIVSKMLNALIKSLKNRLNESAPSGYSQVPIHNNKT